MNECESNVPPPLPVVVPPVIPPPPRVWPVFVLYVVTIVAILVFSVVVVVVVALAKYGIPCNPAKVQRVMTSVPGLLGSVVSTMIAVAGGALAGAWLSRVPWRERLRLRAINLAPVNLVVGSLGVLGIGLVVQGLNGLEWIPRSPVLETLDRFVKSLSAGGLVATVVVIGVLPGIAEELMFRGYVQTRLSERWGPRWGIFVSALMFGVLHFDLVQGSFAVAMGVFLGFLTERSRTIVPAMICHAVNNTVATLSSAWGLDFTSRSANGLALVGGLAVASGAVFYFCREKREWVTA